LSSTLLENYRKTGQFIKVTIFITPSVDIKTLYFNLKLLIAKQLLFYGGVNYHLNKEEEKFKSLNHKMELWTIRINDQKVCQGEQGTCAVGRDGCICEQMDVTVGLIRLLASK
jgi:hypothetical protein